MRTKGKAIGPKSKNLNMRSLLNILSKDSKSEPKDGSITSLT